MVKEMLKELGLTDNEVRIYLLLLKEGTMNPTSIAEKLSLHRGYTYDALERMLDKGVINSILQNNKKHYQATSPKNLVEILKLKLENFKSIVPELMQLSKNKKEPTKVELHKGKRVYRTLLKDIIATVEKNDKILLIGVNEKELMTEVEPIYLKQYLNMIPTRNIKEKIILKKGIHRSNFKNVQYKEIDEKYIGNTEQCIYGNKVALFITGEPHYLVLIENKEVAETYKKQFQLLWKVAN